MNFKNPNLFGLTLLLVSFLVSTWIVMKQTGTLDRLSGRETTVVRFLHWQLEPGFREALQEVIDAYNALPHVKEANYTVQQVAISEKFYMQFLNTHLISGTAPDLSTMGKASLTQKVDQFYDPLGTFVEEPNPYNTPESLPDYLSDEQRDLLINGPWRNTFIDGLQSGYNQDLKNYYAIPVSNWGPIRLFYNKDYLIRAKALLKDAFEESPRPEWLENRLMSEAFNQESGWLPDSPALRKWLENEDAPNTLGKLLLTSDAIWQLARIENRPFLVPIAGSSYTRDIFSDLYAPSFMNHLSDALDMNMDGAIDNRETFGGWRRGDWSFHDREVKAYFETLREISAQFPKGFLGLDREQANRRFIMQNAAMLVTGGWDASSIFTLAKQQADSFEVGVTRLPVPGPGERFHDFAGLPPSEAAQSLGVPMALYKLSSVKDEAIDFLRFITSYQGNRIFVERSGWLPATIGVTPTEAMKPFIPDSRGVLNSKRLQLVGGNVGTVYRGQLYLYIGGDISYDEFVNNVESAMKDPRVGVNRNWFESFQRDGQADRNTQMSMTTESLRYLIEGDEEALGRYYQILQRALTNSNGMNGRVLWKKYFPDEPHPEF